jgi:hypothetical protein
MERQTPRRRHGLSAHSSAGQRRDRSGRGGQCERSRDRAAVHPPVISRRGIPGPVRLALALVSTVEQSPGRVGDRGGAGQVGGALDLEWTRHALSRWTKVTRSPQCMHDASIWPSEGVSSKRGRLHPGQAGGSSTPKYFDRTRWPMVGLLPRGADRRMVNSGRRPSSPIGYHIRTSTRWTSPRVIRSLGTFNPQSQAIGRMRIRRTVAGRQIPPSLVSMPYSSSNATRSR